MATATKSKAPLNTAQREWLKKMGAALDAPVADVVAAVARTREQPKLPPSEMGAALDAPIADVAVGSATSQIPEPARRLEALGEGIWAQLAKLVGKAAKWLRKIGKGRYLCIITVVNKTDLTLTRGESTHKRTAFIIAPPTTIGPRRKKVTFVAAGAAPRAGQIPIEGVVGEFPWLVEGGGKWFVGWAWHLAQKAKFSSRIEGLDLERYQAPKPPSMVGTENEEQGAFFVKVRFELIDSQSPGPDDDSDDDSGTDPEKPQPEPTDEKDIASSCHVTVTNNTQEVLKLVDQDHERGDFMTFPAPVLQPGASTTFVSIETPYSEENGCRGFLVWEVGEPHTAIWRVEWDNPEEAKNTTTTSLEPQTAGFSSLDQIGHGEENVPVAFTISGGGGVQPPESTGKLIVTVRDGNTTEPISGAKVEVAGEPATTDHAGQSEFDKLQAGTHAYKVTADSFLDSSGSVGVVGGEDTELLVVMATCHEPEFVPPKESKQPTLRKGDQSVDGWVEYLQELLGLERTGNFDQKTFDAVWQYQVDNHLAKDGIVGYQTWAHLRGQSPERPSTDRRTPHTYVEHGPEARWWHEGEGVLVYEEPADVLFLVAVSVGDSPIDDKSATVRVTKPNGEEEVVTIAIGPPYHQLPTGAGHLHAARLNAFRAMFFVGPGTYKLEAYLPQDLGGDKWIGQVELK